MTPAEQAYWDRWAPKAIELGTLTPGREPGFELMCQIAAARDVEKGESGWRDLTRQLGQHMARFGLTADGKPPVGAATVDDEEAQLGRLLAVK